MITGQLVIPPRLQSLNAETLLQTLLGMGADGAAFDDQYTDILALP